jgi:hypothetical protein
MFKVSLCTYVENEQTCEKDNWLIADEFGEYATQETAEAVAARLVCSYFEFIDFYCATHNCDGVSFDVVDCEKDEAVTAYELTAAGQATEWRENECHEWKVV